MTMISEAAVSADTQSALLLSAPLWKRHHDAPQPLTPVEYDELTGALRVEGLRPSDLLTSSATTMIPALLNRFPEKMRARVTPDRIARLLERGGQLALALAHWSAAGIWVVSRADATYPTRYKQKLRRSAPPIVYGVGPADLLERGGLAVVGSRKPDAASGRYTSDVGNWAASANVQIISGAARGVDEGAMLACIDAGGTALGVVADSLLKLSTRRDFREAILAGRLALISAFDPDAGFTVPNAMARNRWIYALAERALVVACSEGSGGTWAGAIEAIEHGVLVYVRTGNSERPGNDALVTRGAVPAPEDFSALWNAEMQALQPVPALPAPPAPLPALAATPRPLAALSAPPPPLPKTGDLYPVVAPEIVGLLQDAMNAKKLAETAGLTKSQADAWLKRLLEDGRIEKFKAMYRAVKTLRDQPKLFH